ncbi:MAG: LapA family protein [Candidatus Neomarinimicrobiota bacterium]
MKFLRLIAVIVIMFLMVVFITQNYGQVIHLKFFWNSSSVEMDMVILVFITLMLGLVIGFLIAGVQILAARSDLRVLSNDYKKLKKEIDLLRNQGIDEVDENGLKTE